MRVLRTFDELAALARDVYLAIGVFDGVHLGHQRVIGQARDDARKLAGVSVALTFDPHPLRVLQPAKAPPLLTSTAHKLALIGQLNVDACLLLTFDQPFSETPAAKFIELIAAPRHRLRAVCVGARFRFGHDRAGDVRLMEKLAPHSGFTVTEIPSVQTADGELISSTAVRQHVLAGRLDRAAVMLGRPFSILGTVEKGDRVGHELGYPTANINPHNEALPPNGVYVARVRLGDDTLGGMVNIGIRPTFAGRGQRRVIEAHLFDFNRDLYGQDLEIVFLQKLRDEQKFPSTEALAKQLADDERFARARLKNV